MKEEFLEICNKYIKRPGIDKLLQWLETTDFFTAPASTKFHSNYEGGLCDHSIKVYKRLIRLLENEYGENYAQKVSDESAAILGLFHDICKVNTYKVEMRNVKKDGNWVQEPFYLTDDDLPYGHGEKSVYILNGFIKLTREEAMAINWHMGGFDARVKGGSYSIGEAYYRFPTALLISLADMQATYLDEVVKK